MPPMEAPQARYPVGSTATANAIATHSAATSAPSSYLSMDDSPMWHCASAPALPSAALSPSN